MSYAVPPPPKQRPSVVNAAAILLWVVVAAQVVSLILALLPNEELDRAIEQFNADHPDFQDESQAILVIGGIVGIALTAVIGIGLGVLALFVRRGSQPARIVTWVLGGIFALCQVCGLAGTALPMQGGGQTDGPGSELEEFGRLVEEHTPAWMSAASTLLTIVGLVGLLGAIILLALPAANDYFRKPAEVWVPPTANPGGPTDGGFPPPPPPGTPPNPMAPPPPPPAPPSQQ